MKRFFKLIKSLKLSLFLLIFIIPVIAIGNIVPQKGRFSPVYINNWKEEHPFFTKLVEALGLDHLYTTWWFILLFSILFINITVLTWDLFKRTYYKSKGLHRFIGDQPSYLVLHELDYDKEVLRNYEKALRKRKYNIIKIGNDIYGRKGWIGIWGGTIFHIGLVIILSGAIISGLFKFNGYAELGEGQHMFDRKEYYISINKGVLFPGHKRNVAIKLDKTKIVDTGKIKHLLSTITVTDGKEATVTKTIKMNEPLKFKTLKIYQGRVYGPSLLFVIKGPRKLEKGYVNLAPFKKGTTYALFSIPDTNYQARVDYKQDSSSVDIEIRREKELIYRGKLFRGDSVLLENQTYLILESIARWIGVIVVFDPGTMIVFLGFALSIVGVFFMALFDPKEIWIKFQKDGEREFFKILGWGRWKNLFMEEFQELKRDVEHGISN